jgi:N-acetylneuraminic acid mutarotase
MNNFKLLLVLSSLSICVSCTAQIENSIGVWGIIETNNSPIARHECSFVRVGDKFYLLGGRGIKPISIYDIKANSWSQGSVSPVEIHHFQAVEYEGNIYMFGAMTGKYPYETPLPKILIYNLQKDEWSEGGEIPEERRRGSAGVVVHNDKAYIISGIVDGHNSGHVPWVDMYDFKTKKWSILKDAPRPRDHFHAAINNGKIYALGGRNSSYATQQTFDLTIPEVDVYNIESNTWQTLPDSSNISPERAGTSSAFLGNDLIIIGGESMAQQEAHNDVDAYNLQSMKWRKLSSLNTGRHGSQAIVYKNSIYIVAGSGNRGGKPELSSLEKFSFK